MEFQEIITEIRKKLIMSNGEITDSIVMTAIEDYVFNNLQMDMNHPGDNK